MNTIDAYQFRSITQTGAVRNGSGRIAGFLINSNSSGTIRMLDGLKASLVTYATGTITSDATNPADGDLMVIGSITYRFKTTPAQAYDIKIGADAATTLDNVKAAVNASGTDGTEYYAGTLAHPEVIATTNTNTTQVVQAIHPKAAIGNAIVTTETSAHLSWGAATLAGGVDGSVPMGGTYTVTTAVSSILTFPKPISFGTGLYIIVGGTLDATPIFANN